MASYEFGKPVTNMETLDDIRDEVIAMQRKLDYFSQNLNHHNVKQLYTEYCDIQSAAGETVIDGPLILMYSATDSTTLRLRMGYDSSEFVFELYDLAGNEVISLDSSGDAVFSGSMRTSEEAYIGRNIYIANSSDSPSTDVYRGLWINAGTTYQVALVNDASGGAARLNAYGWLLEYANHVVIRSSAPPPMDGQIQMDSTYGSIYIFASSLIEMRGHDQVWLNSTIGSVHLTASSWVVNNAKALLYCASGGDITLDATGGNVVLKSTGVYINEPVSTNHIGKRKWWKNFTPNVTYTGGPPSSFSTKICRYCVTDYDGWVTLDIESTDGNNAVITAIGDPSSYNTGLYGNPFGCWTGWFNINSTRTPVRVYKFDTTNFVITGAPTLTDNIPWSFMMQGFFGA